VHSGPPWGRLEDYAITATVSAYVEAEEQIAVRFPRITVPSSPRMSFDFPIYVMPYRGSSASALQQLALGDHDVWDPRPTADALRMLRYFPAEFASWIDATPYTYGHANGYAWGDMTATMKAISTDPLEPRALLRDQAFRMLAFFLEAGRKKGAPPNLMMAPQWTKEMKDPNQIRTIVFCQYWEFRLREFDRLLDSSYLTDPEKLEVYRALQSAKNVFAPSESGFAKPTPNGGIWFDYLDLPISAELDWIINTHTTNLGNVGEFALLAKKMGQDDDYRWWQQLFRAGLDGLDYAIRQDWMWHQRDVNELRYAKDSEEGPRDYHYFMLTAWVPRVAVLSLELAHDHTEMLLALERRLLEAEFLRQDPTKFEQSKRSMAELEAKLSFLK
jgi:hypothetical protein